MNTIIYAKEKIIDKSIQYNYSFYISNTCHKKIMQIAHAIFKIKHMTNFVQMPRMLFSTEHGKNTYNILGKEFQLTLFSLIYYHEYNVLFALIKLKKNWTCQSVPHIMLLDSNKNVNIVNNVYINDLLLNKKSYLEHKFDTEYKIDVKIGAEQQEDINIPINEPIMPITPITSVEESDILPKTTEVENSSNMKKIYIIHKPNEIIDTINNKFMKKHTSHEDNCENADDEILILPDYNIVKGPRGGSYTYINGKKKYIPAKKSNIKYSATTSKS